MTLNQASLSLKYQAIVAAGVLMALSPAALAQERPWRDISADVKQASPDGSQVIPTPLYLKASFPTAVKSVNLKGTSYTRVVVSWSSDLLGSTEKKDLLLNCKEHSYKENNGSPGYWYNVEWVLPQKKEAKLEAPYLEPAIKREPAIEHVLLRYFCKTPSPWLQISASDDGDDYYVNMKAAYRVKLRSYGETFTYVMAKVTKYGFSEIRRLYVACKPRKLGIYSLYDAAGDEGITLEEPNPDSVGEGIVNAACSK